MTDSEQNGPGPGSGRLDTMCIPIEKRDETAEHVDYVYKSALWISDADRKGRPRIAKHEEGMLRLQKSSGKVTVLIPIAGLNSVEVTTRAVFKLKSHWKRKEFPDKTGYYSG
jgi:hypothetical protein